MHLLFNMFYKQFGTRRLQQLLAPRFFALNSLPRNTLVHYLSDEQGHADIDTSQLYLADYPNKKIFVDYPEELLELRGNPRKKSIIIRNLVRDFHVKNKQFRYIRDSVKLVKDPLSLVILNYSYLNELYRYATTPITDYNKWFNNNKTIFETIHRISKDTNREHFIFIKVPKDIPGYNILNTYSNKSNLTMIRIFDTPEKKFILELWRWLSLTYRKESILSALTSHDCIRVNLVFTIEDGRSTVVNLGYLNSWIKDTSGKVEESLKPQNLTDIDMVTQYPPEQIQKLFLKFLINLNSSVPVEDPTIDTDLVNPENPIDPDAADIQEDIDIDTLNQQGLVKTPDQKASLPELRVISPHEEIEAETLDLDKQLKEIDEELNTLDTINNKQLKDKGLHIDKDGEEIEVPNEVQTLSHDEIKAQVYQDKSVEESLREQIDANAEFGLLTAAEYRKFQQDLEKYKQMKDPYTGKTSIQEAMTVSSEEIQISPTKTVMPDSDTIVDKSMLKSSLLSFHEDYINNVHRKDIVSMTHNLQKAGVLIKSHEIEIDSSALGEYENHTIEFKPVDGAPSRIRFRIPKISEDGTFQSGGNKYNLRAQRVDIPLRKINPSTVSLSSYYGKTFIDRSTKKANNSVEWVVKQVNLLGYQEGTYITKVAPANVFDNHFKAPYIYNALAHHYKVIKTEDLTLVFDHTDRVKAFNNDPAQLEAFEKKYKGIVVGYTNKKQILVVRDTDEFFIVGNNLETPAGNIFNILKLNEQKAPVDFAELRVFSKTIPVGVVLSYYLGFQALLKLLNIPYRIVENRRNKELQQDEYSIGFQDESYIFSRKHKTASLILGGFLDYDKELRHYPVSAFDKKDVYFNLLNSKGLTSIYIRELNLTQQLFVDPITKSILEDMKEPVTFNGLLIRACEMLNDYHHPDSQDMSQMRIRGYERISGFIYKELATAIRAYRNKNIAGKSKIDISPYQVWSAFMKDPSIKLMEDINPIQNLKESEVVTHVGEGGRSKDGMNKASRAFHPNDMGIISEASVDSSDVGVNAYMSANPNIRNLRGLPSQEKKLEPSSLISTSGLLAPFVTNDDVKRANFVSIMNSHTVATEGYHQPLVRTGYESVIGNRTHDMFCFTARQDGKVVSVTDKGIIVEYKDGTRKGVTLGRIYGKAEGSVYPHDVKTFLKENSSFKAGDCIAYNDGFFEPDFMNPGRVVFKTSMLVKVALVETNQTFEDSSSISRRLSNKFNTKTTKVKSITVNFKQNLNKVLMPGTQVKPKDILMYIEDEITSSSGQFDEQSLETLKRLGSQTPHANYTGVIDKIEVLYHGDKQDMSASLKLLADRSDRSMADMCKSSGKPVITGQVNDEYRVSGVPLTLDKAEIKIYITTVDNSSTGDKIIMANQMKSVIGEVMDYQVTTENGDEIDMFFSYKNILSRIVNSPILIGTTSSLLKIIGQKAVQLYDGE